MVGVKTRSPILVVDDDGEDRDFIEQALRKNGIENPIFQLEDGKELLNYLTHQGKYLTPDSFPKPGLIFLDLNMPRMDGRAILRHIKTDGLLKKIPVVVLTTSREREDILETYNMGANIFFSKPNDFNGLLNLMETTKKYWLEMAELPVE